MTSLFWPDTLVYSNGTTPLGMSLASSRGNATRKQAQQAPQRMHRFMGRSGFDRLGLESGRVSGVPGKPGKEFCISYRL
jgi:hypothetical protein